MGRSRRCASVTERLRFCSDVSIPTHEAIEGEDHRHDRNPGTGAVLFGLGVGWMQEEFAATGYSFSRRGQTVDGLIVMMTESGTVEPLALMLVWRCGDAIVPATSA